MAEKYITIAVTNVNDQRPVFDPNKYLYNVTENTDCDKAFGQVSSSPGGGVGLKILMEGRGRGGCVKCLFIYLFQSKGKK